MAETVYLSLGSNLGDRQQMLDIATQRLAETGGLRLLATSSTYASSPIDCPPGCPDFLNRILKLECRLAPTELLDITQELERSLGRREKGNFAPRTIDIDIVLFGDTVIHTHRLAIPHPRMRHRPFVLIPLCEVAPETIDPETKTPFADLLDGLDRQGLTRCEEMSGVQ